MIVEFEPIVVILFIIAGTSILWIAKHVFGSYASPVGIFGSVWCFSLAFFYLGISKFYVLNIESILVFAGTICLFLLGAFAAIGFSDRKRAPSLRMEQECFSGSDQLHYVVYVIFAIGVFGSMAYYQRLHQLIGIESLWSDPIKVRIEESVGVLRQPGWVGLARSLLIPCFVLTIISLNLPQYKSNISMWSIAVISFILMLPSSGRTTIGTMIVWALIARVYLLECSGEKSPIKKSGVWILVITGLFVLYFLTTTNMLKKAVDIDAGIADVGVYTVSSFSAFQEMVRSPEQFDTKASLTFGVVSRILHEFDPDTFAYPEYVQPMVGVPITTNIYTYLDAFFIDFGWIGVVVFPYLVGLLTTILYLHMRKSHSIIEVYIASLLSQCLFQSIGVNRFGNLLTWVWILVPIFAGGVISFIAPRR